MAGERLLFRAISVLVVEPSEVISERHVTRHVLFAEPLSPHI
jgi:hypothetical protein